MTHQHQHLTTLHWIPAVVISRLHTGILFRPGAKHRSMTTAQVLVTLLADTNSDSKEALSAGVETLAYCQGSFAYC